VVVVAAAATMAAVAGTQVGVAGQGAAQRALVTPALFAACAADLQLERHGSAPGPHFPAGLLLQQSSARTAAAVAPRRRSGEGPPLLGRGAAWQLHRLTCPPLFVGPVGARRG
jgi:hypothetical protein